MVIDNIFGLNSAANQSKTALPGVFSRIFATVSRQLAKTWCGLHGHLILMHFEPNKLSLQCALCGYETEGWEVGRPAVARRQAEERVHPHHARTDRRRTLHAVPSGARMAS
jgi:hypothetical protein